MENHIITLAGNPGSGKSKSGKGVASQIGFTHTSSGDFARAFGIKHGMSIEEIGFAAENNPALQYDESVDAWVRSHADKENLVIDSRLGFHWLPNSFKVYLYIDPKIAAQRMFDDLKTNEHRRKSEHFETIEEMEASIVRRFESDKKRYAEKYGIDYSDLSKFNLVINTGLPENSIEVVVAKIIAGYKAWLQEQKQFS